MVRGSLMQRSMLMLSRKRILLGSGMVLNFDSSSQVCPPVGMNHTNHSVRVKNELAWVQLLANKTVGRRCGSKAKSFSGGTNRLVSNLRWFPNLGFSKPDSSASENQAYSVPAGVSLAWKMF
jgi:hypothetical protein